MLAVKPRIPMLHARAMILPIGIYRCSSQFAPLSRPQGEGLKTHEIGIRRIGLNVHTRSFSVSAYNLVSSGTITSLAGLAVFGGAISWWHRDIRGPQSLRSLINGPKISADVDKLLPRVAQVDKILRLITPEEGSEYTGYHLILGKAETGKTALIQLALAKLALRDPSGPSGVVYADLSRPEEDFAEGFAEGLGWDSARRPFSLKDLLIPTYISNEPFKTAWSGFACAAEKYKAQYGKTPVLILDNIDCLADSEYGLLNWIQEATKEAADEKKFTVVIVIATDGTLRRLRERNSSWSRVGDIHTVPDISADEALKYSQNIGWKIDSEKASELCKRIGNRFTDLKRAGVMLRHGDTIEEVCKKNKFVTN